MYNILKKVVLCLLAVMILTVPNSSFAKSNVVIEKISYNIVNSEQGETYLHIEVNTNREVKDFSVEVNENNNQQLIFTLQNAKIGNISHQEKLDGDFAKKVFLQDIDEDNVQGKIYLTAEAYNNYKIYSLGKNGVAIDIYKAEEIVEVQNDIALGNLKNKLIAVDAGHGGSDTGAIGPTGFTEKEATLAISQKVTNLLNKAGAKVVMTRNDDRDVYGPNASATNELQARVNVGNNYGADIFVSIHCNAFINPSANGTQTFYYGSSYQGQRLADNIQTKMIEANGLYNRGISTCNFYVVKHSYMPAVLIETAFISNYNEEALLSDDTWQENLAKAIVEGINQYFGEF